MSRSVGSSHTYDRSTMPSLLAPRDRLPVGAAARLARNVGGARPAILLLAGAILGTWLGSGVAISELLRFVAFELLYVVMPGSLLYVLLNPAPGGRLRTLAIGWPLGYALEMGAFALSAALHVRGLFALLPLAALIAAAPLFLRAAGRERLRALYRPAPAGSLSDLAPAAGAVAAAVVVLAFTFFASSPLPRDARSVAYVEDSVSDISIAADARHHWPITEPWVAGQPLHYYTGVFIHAAAVNQVVGVSLSTLFLRLLPSTMFLIAALQLCALGGSVGRSRWIGPLAAALLLVTQDVNLSPTRSQVFYIDPFTQFPLSPTFAFGVPFFLGGLLLIQSRFVRPPSLRLSGPRGRAGVLLTLGILVAGMTAAKAFAAFDFAGGLGLYWLWCVAGGRASRGLTYCLAVTALAALAIYFLMIAGGGAATMSVRPFSFIQEGDTLARATHLAKQVVGPSLYWLALAGGSVVIALCLLAPLLGAGWLIWKERGAPDSSALLVAMFVVGSAAYVLLGAPGGVEGVFLIYGYVALVPVAARGLVVLWGDTPVPLRRRTLRACAALLALGLAIATLSASLTLTGTARYGWFAVAYGSVAGGIVLVVWRFRAHYRARIPSRTAQIAACCIPLLSALALVKPMTLVGSGAWKTVVGKPTSAADTGAYYGMTAALYRGLLWVRTHTTPCDVLVVNNHYESAEGERGGSVYFYYSAFTERRVFLESWRYTADGQRGAQPYPARFALNEQAIAQGDPKALRELARRGVKYVLIDKSHGGGAQESPSVSTLVFANRALDVHRLLGVRQQACATVTWPVTEYSTHG